MVVKSDSEMVARKVARLAERMVVMALVSVRMTEVAKGSSMVHTTAHSTGFELA